MFTMTDNKRKKLKQFAAMSRPKNSNREWNYMYFWAESQKEAKDKWATLTDRTSIYMDYKLERIRAKHHGA